ncbi:AAA family ATPase [Dactylosporangium sp. NPDC005555]|uniref:AAA family ATPase n=1 Tax=Dactylosporangium sp. NPDC005555 TaxID=3154889 RepID=UPI0033B7CEA4
MRRADEGQPGPRPFTDGQEAGAGPPLLKAKLSVPEPAVPGVRRQRLLDLLVEHTDLPLTVITGPPGSGKTQLAVAWVADELPQGPIAWVTLDEDDRDDTVRLWRHVFEALRRAGLLLPTGFWDAATWRRPGHDLATEVASALHEQQRDILLVLDNAALLGPQQCTELEFVLRNADGGLRLLLLGRRRPAFPLHQYRLSGGLAELDAADLAFDEDEIAELLDLHGVWLTREGLADLARFTEGWLVAVRLAATVLAAAVDPETNVRRLGEDDAFNEYFTAEVLGPLRPRQREFLHRLGVLDTFTADLAMAVGDMTGGRPLLLGLLGEGIFAEQATHPPTFRLNRLLADVLRFRLRDDDPDVLRRLHLRAARWWAGSGDVVTAVWHTTTAELWQESAELIVEHVALVRMLVDNRDRTLLQLLSRMPQGFGPAQTIVTAVVAIANGHIGTAERLLARLGADPAALPTERLRLGHAVVDLAVSLGYGDAARTVAAARKLERLLDDATQTRPVPGPEVAAFVVAAIGTAELWAGRLAAAVDTLAEAIRLSAGAHCDEIRLWCAEHLALAEAHHGRLGRAVAAAVQTRALAAAGAPATAMHWVAVLDVALAVTALERFDTVAAWHHLNAAEAGMHRAGDRFQDVLYTATLALVRARLLRAGNDLPGALAVVREALRPPTGRPTRDWLRHRLTAVEARILLAMGRVEEATALIGTLGDGDPATGVLEAEALLARGDADCAAELARTVADDGATPPGTLIDAWLLLAAVDARAGRLTQAGESLRRAVAIAVPEGIVRSLYETGGALRRLLFEEGLPGLDDAGPVPTV